MSETIVKRIWERDSALWKSDPAHQEIIRERLGWLTVAEAMLNEVPRLKTFADKVKNEGFKDIVLMGMGGSSLAPEVFARTFAAERGPAASFPRLHILDSTDPAALFSLEENLSLPETLFIVSSKSGGTIETDSFFQYFYAKIPEGKNFIAITDPGTSLEKLGKEKKFREIFLNPSDIGGRYSALSFFGLVPAALIGIDIKKLLESAIGMMKHCKAPDEENPGASLGAFLGNLYLKGKDKVTFISEPSIESFGSWAEQLLAESTGKEGKGLVPVDEEPIGSAEVYRSDRVFVYLRLNEETELKESVGHLHQSGFPLFEMVLNDRHDLGAAFFQWEFATAVAGSILKIDPFDQPNVQESKDNTKAILEQFKRDRKLPEEKLLFEKDGLRIFGPQPPGRGESLETYLNRFLTPKDGDYLAFLAYLERTAMHEEKLEILRAFLRNHLKIATTVGFGPRFLHSTGQLHKGGSNNGMFVQITVRDAIEISIPGQPYGFSILKQAQALGDYQSLIRHGRRVIRIDIGESTELGLNKMIKLCDGLLRKAGVQ